jgi:hypothetical protein
LSSTCQLSAGNVYTNLFFERKVNLEVPEMFELKKNSILTPQRLSFPIERGFARE